ncbi:MAG TPA: hypothetical protein VHD36_08885 [Pirellulales bacterium]|nr:hypothetical protein [Pirellulales bacterium]
MQKPIAFTVLVCASLIAPWTAYGQEELPAPPAAPSRPAAPRPAPAAAPRSAPVPGAVRPPLRRPLTDDERAQRRERLLNLGGQVLNSLVPADPNAPGAAPIDMGRLNGALGPLVTALLGGGRDIESLRIGFDPQATNFAEDRARLSFDASLRRTAWDDAPSRINGTIGANVAQRDTGGLVAVIDGRVHMQTSTVALANYALVEYKKRSAERTPQVAPAPADAVGAPVGAPAASTTTDEIFGQLLDERLARFDRFESLDDVADMLTAISGLRLTAADQHIEQLRNAVRAEKDPAARQELSEQLTATRAERDRLLDVRPRIERGSNGVVHTISLDMIGSEIFPGADLRQLECRIQENEIWIQASGAMTRWMELYPVFKPLVMGVLQRIQSGDPRALDGVRPFVDGPIGQGRAIIIGRP